uniref:general stress protein n=1 Tax=uncultured Sphingomonas sp. TaxID=158754 RepID=UPI0035CC7C24
MTQTITGLFDHYDDARRAVQDLEAAGVTHRDISIVGHDKGEHAGSGRVADVADPAAEDAGKGAGIGAAVGGVGGLLAGLGLLAIPGIGPVVAAGWLAATAAGAVGGGLIGGATGGLIGALTHAGVPENDAHVYAEGVRRGGTLVTAKVDEPLVPTARNILGDDRTVNVAERRNAYETQGWSSFDEAAPAFTDSDIAAERARYDRV